MGGDEFVGSWLGCNGKPLVPSIAELAGVVAVVGEDWLGRLGVGVGSF